MTFGKDSVSADKVPWFRLRAEKVQTAVSELWTGHVFHDRPTFTSTETADFAALKHLSALPTSTPKEQKWQSYADQCSNLMGDNCSSSHTTSVYSSLTTDRRSMFLCLYMTDSWQYVYGFNFRLYYLLLHRRDIKVGLAYAFALCK